MTRLVALAFMLILAATAQAETAKSFIQEQCTNRAPLVAEIVTQLWRGGNLKGGFASLGAPFDIGGGVMALLATFRNDPTLKDMTDAEMTALTRKVCLATWAIYFEQRGLQ